MNNGQFKKGQSPWNKGTKGVMKSNTTSFKTGGHPGKEFQKGNIPHNKGIPATEETKKNLVSFKKGCIPWNKGIDNRPEINCNYCNKDFKTSNQKIERNKYNFCNIECRSKFMASHPEIYFDRKKVNCKNCNFSFEVIKSSKRRFCSKSCASIYNNTGKIFTPATLEKMRKSRIAYIEEKYNNNEPISPNVGKSETNVLNILEKNFGYKILRQYRVAGYFIDGYCPALNLAIEIDEPHHNMQINKDIERENIIKERIGCQFFRIPVMS